MPDRIVFYQLGRKVVSNQENVQENARQVIYYSLAIGHHLGVMDCFSVLMEVQLEEFKQWISHLPEGSGRRKLEGVLKWGEIEINRSHVNELVLALNANLSRMSADEACWTDVLVQFLRKIIEEPILYLIVKKYT
jgi:hydrogenase-4 component J